MPFEVPKGWVWCRLGDVFSHNTGKALNSSNKEGENLTYITTSNVYWDRFELNDLKKMPFTNSELEKCTVSKGDLLVCEGGDIGRSAIWNFDYDIRIQNHIHRLRPISEANVHFYYYVLMYNKQAGLIGGKGIGLMGLSSGELDKMIVPLPPIKEQCRITKEIEKLFAIVSLIEEDESDLKNAIQKAKSTILDLALSGRLTSHTSHYPQLPERWENKNFAQLFEVLASKSYQIQQKEIHQSGKYPVISQSASYIEGYSDREEKLYNLETPVIIFGDHTRNVKYVNFDFIVGADGVKILKPMINSKFAYYLTLYNSKQIENRGYSRHFQYLKKLSCRIPSEKEQQRIVEIIEHYFYVFDVIITELSHF